MVTKLVDPGSILGRTSTQGRKISMRKCYLYIDVSKWLDFCIFSDKDVKIVDTLDPPSTGIGNQIRSPMSSQLNKQSIIHTDNLTDILQ